MYDRSSKNLQGYMHVPSQRTTATAAYNSRRNSLSHYKQEDDNDLLALTAGDLQDDGRNTLDQTTRLRDLRENRRKIEQKFLRITTRMNFMKKKESESLKHAIDAKNKLQNIYVKKHKQMSQQKFYEQLEEKKRFEEWKKNQEVQSFRNHLQLTKKLMAESVHSRKIRDVERFRGRRYSQKQQLTKRKQLSLIEKQQMHDRVLQMHEKQAIKKKLLDMSKKLNCRDNVQDRIEQYEMQVARAYEYIQQLKRRQIELGRVSQQSSQIFKSIMQDFNRLKKS